MGGIQNLRTYSKIYWVRTLATVYESRRLFLFYLYINVYFFFRSWGSRWK